MNKPKVLLVDDDLSVLDALGSAIESEGFELVRAADGHQAVERFYQRPVDIVVLDLMMPVKSGWDTFERLRTINPLLPVIVITARSDAYSTAVAKGVARLMQKPLDIPVLLETMRELLAEPPAKRLSYRPWTANADNLLNQTNAFSLADSRNDDARPIVIKSKRATSDSFGG